MRVETNTNDSRTYAVSGMTCAHCVASVTEEVSEVAGVAQVEVDLDSGALVVTGAAEVAAVLAAVDEAGYSAVVVGA